MPARKRAHYRGNYQRSAATIRNAANADPTTKCWRDGLTLAEHQALHPGKTLRWEAGHIRDGDPTSPLAPEVSCCNHSAGATAGNRRRIGITTTRDW